MLRWSLQSSSLESSRALEKLLNQLGEENLSLFWHRVRLLPEDKRSHLVRACSAGQIESKLWLVDTLKGVVPRQPYNICIVAGWIGILAPLLWWLAPDLIRRLVLVENDPEALEIARRLHPDLIQEKKLELVFADANTFNFDHDFQLVINCACEHFESDQWFRRIPDGRLVVTQSTNSPAPDHVRPAKSAANLGEQYPMSLWLYSGYRVLMDYEDKRYMRIGRK